MSETPNFVIFEDENGHDLSTLQDRGFLEKRVLETAKFISEQSNFLGLERGTMRSEKEVRGRLKRLIIHNFQVVTRQAFGGCCEGRRGEGRNVGTVQSMNCKAIPVKAKNSIDVTA